MSDTIYDYALAVVEYCQEQGYLPKGMAYRTREVAEYFANKYGGSIMEIRRRFCPTLYLVHN